MTYKEAAQSALDVQNGCNASGIIRSLAGVTSVLWEHANEHQLGSKWVNRHPIIAMYLFKIGELNGYGISSLNHGYSIAEQQVTGIVEGLPEPDFREWNPLL